MSVFFPPLFRNLREKVSAPRRIAAGPGLFGL